MQPKSKNVTGEANVYDVANPAGCSETWWNNTRYNSFSSTAMRGNASDSSSLEQSMDGQSQSEDRTHEEDDDDHKNSPSNISLRPERNNRQGDVNIQQVHPMADGNLTQPAQLELVGHSIACAPNPYDPYYAGMVAAYGQPTVPHLYDMHHQVRMPLPLEMAQEPVYVNAKQYQAILRRRQSRAKAELEKKLIKARKPYLHESRHQHAMRRARGSGGRFAKKSVEDASNKGTGTGSSASSHSINSSGCGGEKAPQSQSLYNSDYGNYRNQANSQESLYESRSGKNGEGPAPGQQWGNIPSNHALAMQ